METKWENAAIIQDHKQEWREHFRRLCLRQSMNLWPGYAEKGKGKNQR